MSTNINTQLLKKFIMQTLNVGQKLDSMEAKKLGVLDEYDEYNNAVGQDEIDISIEDVLNDKNLYTQFAKMYTEAENEKNNEVDKEKEKEEQNKVNEKNEAKA